MARLRMAWRNLWRNWRRSAITLAAVTFSIIFLVAGYSLMDGIMVQTVRNATDLWMGEVQVHHPDYVEERSFYDSIADPEKILKYAEEKGLYAAARSYGAGLVAHDTKSAGAFFWGVTPAAERGAFKLAGHVMEGGYLPDAPEMKAVIGKKLAKKLGVGVGDELVVLVQCADGSLGNELFTVAGILKSVGDEVDRAGAIIHADDFEELFVSGGRVHEVAVDSRGAMTPESLAVLMKPAAPDDEVVTWKDLMPTLAKMLALFDQMMFVFGLIFSLAAGVSVMNALLMATFERLREFGTVKALGATPMRIVVDVAAEAFLLCGLATLIGVAVSLPLCYLLQVKGIDTGAIAGDITFEGVAFDPIWRAVLSVKNVVVPVLIAWVFCVVSALYPAIIAARLNPVDAMRKP